MVPGDLLDNPVLVAEDVDCNETWSHLLHRRTAEGTAARKVGSLIHPAYTGRRDAVDADSHAEGFDRTLVGGPSCCVVVAADEAGSAVEEDIAGWNHILTVDGHRSQIAGSLVHSHKVHQSRMRGTDPRLLYVEAAGADRIRRPDSYPGSHLAEVLVVGSDPSCSDPP